MQECLTYRGRRLARQLTLWLGLGCDIVSCYSKDQKCLRYYVPAYHNYNWSPVYRACFRMQRGNGIGSFFRGLFRFLKPLLYSGAKAVEKEALKTGSHIITDILNKEPEQPVGDIFKTRFSVANGNLDEKIKKMTGSGLGLKRKHKPKKSLSQGKRRKVKDIFTEKKRNK